MKQPDVVLDNGNIKLFCGDCLEILPTLEAGSVDAVVTDPPYSSGGQFRGDRAVPTRNKYQSSDVQTEFASFSGDNRDQRSWLLWMTLWLTAVRRLVSQGAMVCVFTDWRQLPTTTDAVQVAGLVWRGIVPWDKVQARPAPNRFRAQAEYLVWGTNGPRDSNTEGARYHDGVFRVTTPPTSERQHATQKPVALMERICAIADEGTTVLDPFMGSGTTGVACVKTGRKFIGIELDRGYFDISVKRIEKALKERDEQLIGATNAAV